MTTQPPDGGHHAESLSLRLAEKVLEFLAGGMERQDEQDLLVHLHQLSRM